MADVSSAIGPGGAAGYDEPAGVADTALAPERPGTPGDKTYTKRKLGLGFWLPAIWVGIVLFSAIFGSVLPLDNPNDADPCAQYAEPTVNLLGGPTTTIAPGTIDENGVDISKCTAQSKPGALPNAKHLAGTDSAGRDNLARLVAGARVSMIAGVITIAIGVVIGGTIGLLAGYFRGTTETILMAVADIMLAFPTLVLALAVVAILGRGLFTVGVAITIVSIPGFARITRASTLTYAEREFVTAAKVMGAKHSRIILREILPNVIFPVLAVALVGVAIAIVAEGALAFLSLSVKDPQASWGQMINDGKGALTETPQVALIPAAVMFVTVLCFNLLGDKFRQIFNVKDAAL